MPGCAAVNCSSHSRNGHRLFLFPSDPERRKRWLINCRRDSWTPTKFSRLCEKHFELNQFELNRKDNSKKLKPFAIPTIFDVPNPPKKLESKRRTLKRKFSEDKIGTKDVVIANADEDHSYAKHPRHKIAESLPHYSEIAVTSHSSSSSCTRCHQLELENRQLKRKIANLEASIANTKKALSGFFRDDQMQALAFSSKFSNKWSDDTVKAALQIRCACGIKGYEFLRQLNFPIPAYRTLCSRISNVRMYPGLQFITMDWMNSKMQNMQAHEKLCCLVLDEVQISKCIQYDPGLRQFAGFISDDFKKKDSCDAACHVLCYLAKGITSHWKQIVAYYYTGASVKGEQLWRCTRKIIHELGIRGFTVQCIVSDMGGSNQAMWKCAGVTSNRNELVESVGHPVHEGELLRFVADVPHLIKNLRSALLRQDFVLPDFIVDKYGLPTATVTKEWLEKLVDYQSHKQLKLAPKLTAAHLWPSKFQKMNVRSAAQVFSNSTASALKTLVAQRIFGDEALTTAFFCEYFNKWFDALNCRFLANALYPLSNDKIDFLREVMLLMQKIQIGSAWKPIQSGIRLSTSSILSLHQHLVVNGDLKFLLTARFTQDALENIFSQVRSKGVIHPKPVQFRLSLRLICLAQFMSVPSSGSYDVDDTPHLVSFLKSNKDDYPDIDKDFEVQYEDDEAALRLLSSAADFSGDVCESNGFYYAAGWAVFKELQKIDCELCSKCFSSSGPATHLKEFSHLTSFKSYQSGVALTKTTDYLCHPSKISFNLLRKAEMLLRDSQDQLLRHSCPQEFILSKVDYNASEFTVCHCVAPAILKRYIKLRLHILASNISNVCDGKQVLASKTAARSFLN